MLKALARLAWWNKKYRYFYFISYAHQEGFGSVHRSLESEIKSIEQIQKLEQEIVTYAGVRNPCLVSFQLLRIERHD